MLIMIVFIPLLKMTPLVLSKTSDYRCVAAVRRLTVYISSLSVQWSSGLCLPPLPPIIHFPHLLKRTSPPSLELTS